MLRFESTVLHVQGGVVLHVLLLLRVMLLACRNAYRRRSKGEENTHLDSRHHTDEQERAPCTLHRHRSMHLQTQDAYSYVHESTDIQNKTNTCCYAGVNICRHTSHPAQHIVNTQRQTMAWLRRAVVELGRGAHLIQQLVQPVRRVLHVDKNSGTRATDPPRHRATTLAEPTHTSHTVKAT